MSYNIFICCTALTSFLFIFLNQGDLWDEEGAEDVAVVVAVAVNCVTLKAFLQHLCL